MGRPGSLSAANCSPAPPVSRAPLPCRAAPARRTGPLPTPTGTPPSTITTPPRDWIPGHPSIFPDPDVIAIDPSFRQFAPGNSAVKRLWTGAQWAEGPAWSSQGQYLVFSDVSGNVQYRDLWDAERVAPFRKPSSNTNGNSFDLRGPPAVVQG